MDGNMSLLDKLPAICIFSFIVLTFFVMIKSEDKEDFKSSSVIPPSPLPLPLPLQVEDIQYSNDNDNDDYYPNDLTPGYELITGNNLWK